MGRRLAVAALLVLLAPAARAQVFPGKIDPDGYTFEKIQQALPEYFQSVGDFRARPADIPDVFGPGAVLRVGNVYMKVTNFGHCGNFFTNLSSDPAGQWPGASGVEYLSTIRLAVAAKNPQATDPNTIRRVSYLFEWRPPTLDPIDKIYKSYDGIINGARFVNDDKPDLDARGVPRIDEDFLDGRDDDLDGKIDEDFGALGQAEYTCLMRDDTREALNSNFNEKHVPLGLEVRQAAWAYSIPGFSDFDVIEYTIYNKSGHTLDSMCVGWLVDMDCGPVSSSSFFRDDLDLPGYPSGEFVTLTSPNDKRLQDSTMRGDDPTNPRDADVKADSALCPRFTLRINGFSIADDNGDEQQTKGIPSFLLVNATIDPLGHNGPSKVAFNSFRSFTAQTPFVQGGNPIVDQQRFEMMSGTTKPTGIDPETGFINVLPGDQKGDYVEWCSVGPYRNIVDGGSIQATVAFQVLPGPGLAQDNYQDALSYQSDYDNYKAGILPWATMKEKYPSLDNALAIQVAYEGIWGEKTELSGHPEWPYLTNGHGRETAIIAPPGTGSIDADPDCRELPNHTNVTENAYEWFDYDCNYCTGAFNSKVNPKRGMFHYTWNVGAPPPNPDTNVGVGYNYTANPDRQYVPAGDGAITLAWNNLSEVTTDPKSGVFDFRGYKVWKAANWTRPVGSAGPSDDDWSLMGEFRSFNYLIYRQSRVPPDTIWMRANYDSLDFIANGKNACPQVFFPNYFDPDSQRYVGPKQVRLCLNRFDLWERQSGIVIRPNPNLNCEGYPGACKQDLGVVLSPNLGCDESKSDNPIKEFRVHYPVGRYELVDHEVKNGFVYFYSVTAFDSCSGSPELNGRRAAVEAEGVVPQLSASRTHHDVWVVPNPYRGYTSIAARPSSWDLTPNATDPTGTHIDFLGLPPEKWTIKIFTVSGDLVAELHSDDPINESLRGTVVGADGKVRPGSNKQQDNPDDGQARWNLISRNGQDIVSGIYLFTVDSKKGTQRGKFVVIR